MVKNGTTSKYIFFWLMFYNSFADRVSPILLSTSLRFSYRKDYDHLIAFRVCSVFVGTNHDLPKETLKGRAKEPLRRNYHVVPMDNNFMMSKTVPFAGHLRKDLQYVLDRMRPG